MKQERDPKKGDVTSRVVSYLLKHGAERAQKDGKLVYVDVDLEAVATAAGTTPEYVRVIFEGKLSYVVSCDEQGVWGLISGTFAKLEDDLAHMPQPGVVHPRGGGDTLGTFDKVYSTANGGRVLQRKGYFR